MLTNDQWQAAAHGRQMGLASGVPTSGHKSHSRAIISCVTPCHHRSNAPWPPLPGARATKVLLFMMLRFTRNKFFSFISDTKCQSYRDVDAIWILFLINHFIIESKEFDWTYQWVKLLTAQIPQTWLKNSFVFYWQNILWLQNWNRDENKFAFWLVAALLKYLSQSRWGMAGHGF